MRRNALRVKPGLAPWEPHVPFRGVQTLVREGSPLVKQLCLAATPKDAELASRPQLAKAETAFQGASVGQPN